MGILFVILLWVLHSQGIIGLVLPILATVFKSLDIILGVIKAVVNLVTAKEANDAQAMFGKFLR